MSSSYQTFENEPTENEKEGSGTIIDEGGYTVEEAVEHIGFGWFQLKLSCVAGLAWMADSMEIMAMSILGPVLVCQWGLNSVQEAMITTVVFIGFSFGAPLMGWLADKFGRRTSLLIAAAVAAVFGILSAVSPIYAVLLVLRALTGVGIAGTPQAVTYYAEFLPLKYRGKCIIGLEVLWALGALIDVALAIGILENYGWRWWLAASSTPLILFIILSMTVPESPRYLISCGRIQAAEDALKRVAKCNRKSMPEGDLMPEAEVPRARFSDLMTLEYRRSTLLLWFIWFVTTFAYYGVVLMTTELIKRGNTCVGDSLNTTNQTNCPNDGHALSNQDYIELMWTSVAELPGLLLTAIYVDCVDRRVALGINLVVFSASMFTLFICLDKIFMLSMLFCARAFIASAMQVAYVYTPELYPTAFRALGLGSANFFARIGAVITPFVAQVLLQENLGAALTVYGVLGLVATVATALLPIDTRKKKKVPTATLR